jgi:hypothetical protein
MSAASRAEYATAGEQHLQRVRPRDLPLEADRRAADREQPALHLEEPERGGLPRDPDVGPLEDLGTAGHAVALDRGDHGFARPVVPQHRLPVQIGVGLEAVPVLLALHPLAREGLEVHARAERAARAGEDDRADGVVRVGLDPAVVQADQHRQRERVLGLGPVEREHQCGAFALHGEVFRPTHCRPPVSGTRTGCRSGGASSRVF